MIYSSCIDLEQTNYNSIKSEWNDLSDQIRNHCNQVAQFSGGSYQILKSCVDLEKNAANNTSKFKF